MRKFLFFGVCVMAAFFIHTQFLQAQSTEFTYQGSLKDGANPATGNYDFAFLLYTAVSGGVPVGSPVVLSAVPVNNGVFSVRLNFGNNFSGANRFLEIQVRPVGGGTFTTLNPRQLITSEPYAVQSLNASQLGGVAANQYVISGATSINAATQFNIGGNRVLGVGGTANTFGGVNAGANASNLAENNTFFGNSAGMTMVTAGGNSFFGSEAGMSATSGGDSFFGAGAGRSTTTGSGNSFFGSNTGASNTTGGENSFFGRSAGSSNQTGSGNSFFGYQAGISSNTSNNSFFGYRAGRDSTGIGNSFFGWSSGTATSTGTNNSFFGVQSGLNNTTGIRNVFIGRDAGLTNVSGSNNTIIGAFADVSDAATTFATAIGAGTTTHGSNTVSIGRAQDQVYVDGTFFVNKISSDGPQSVTTIEVTHKVAFTSAFSSYFDGGLATSLASGGGANGVCFTGSGSVRLLAFCGSSIRFKKNIESWYSGLDLIRRLRPVSFNWKRDDVLDVGLIAEEVASVEPLLVTHNDKSEIEGVKYDRISVVLVNAVKEQQAQIESQQTKIQQQSETILKQDEKIDELKKEIDGLRKLVCSINPGPEGCVPRK